VTGHTTNLGRVVDDETDQVVERILGRDTKRVWAINHDRRRYCAPMVAGTWESHHAITTLLYRYAECMDAADFDAITELFADAVLTNEGVDGEVRGGEAISGLYRRTNRVHDDGTLRTRHVTSNVIVDIDEQAGTATARSIFVVFQQTPKVALQPIVSGSYRDRFARTGDEWRFTHRHIVVDLIGDVSDHLAFDLAAFRAKHSS
jgi:3-phenylpropionate/cinnamic acid dioxygenase small subunit